MTPQFLSYSEENALLHSLPTVFPQAGKHPRSFPTDSLLHIATVYARDSRRWLKWWLSLHRTAEMRRSLHSVRNLYRGSPALVLGNGPSAKELQSRDINEFVDQGGHLFTVNDVFANSFFELQKIFCHTLSDPISIDHLAAQGSPLHQFLSDVDLNFLYVPDRQSKKYRELLPHHHILPFCDTEIRTAGWKRSMSIRPDRPRSYVSLTLYKALALSIWMGHSPIYIAGFDNTYVRDLYCGPRNEIVLRQRHFYGEGLPGDYSLLYASISDVVFELALVFSDLKKFAAADVLNLDPYSLTDGFRKAQTLEQARAILKSASC